MDRPVRRARGSRLWPLYAGLVLVAALVPTWSSTEFEFVWDDQVMIGPILDMRGLPDVVRLWNTPFDALLRDPVIHNTYFRPLVILSLALDRAMHGSDPFGFHVTNLLAYAVACLFLWLLAWEISGRPGPAAVGTVVFALHPTHPESVCFIAGRTDVMCGAFLFASLWTAARWGPRIRSAARKLVPASALLLLAFLCKEVALFALPLLPLTLWIRERGLRSLALATAPVLAAAFIYWIARVSVLGMHTLPTASPVEGTWPQILTSVSLVARYVPLLFLPISLSARHEIPPVTAPNALFALGLLTLAAVAAGSILLVRRRSRWSLPLLLAATTLLPLCIARLIAGALIAERFLFIPSGALALGIALLPGVSSYVAAGVTAPLFLILLIPRVAIWKDDLTLYSSMLRDSPRSAYAHAILGSYYYDRRDLPRAIEHHRRAFELKPAFNESLLNLSAAEDESGQTDSAFAHVRLLIQLRPNYAAAWYALGNLHVHVDQPDSAIHAYEESIRLDPRFAQAENNLGVVLERVGRVNEAIAHYRKALEALPGYPDAANNLTRLGVGARPDSAARTGVSTRP